MADLNEVVVISSDDEEVDLSLSLNRGPAKSKTRSLITSSNPRSAKKSRPSNSVFSLFSEPGAVDEIKSSFEDFDGVPDGSKVSNAKLNVNDDLASGSISTKEPWANKYKPSSLEELAVHKKKVEEVKVWFEERLKNSKVKYSNQVLLITGQAGVGKTATVRVIASHLKAKLYEWITPTPTIWQEHVHNRSTGVQYTSKLDEFEDFVERIRKYGLITQFYSGKSASSVMLLIDDLPETNGRIAFERLKKCLQLLVSSIQIPTALVVTDYSKVDPGDSTARRFEELELSLENAGAYKVAFNPITPTSIKKTLFKICRQEQYTPTAEHVDLLAKASGGDIRHAVTSLQLLSLEQHPMLNLSLSITSSRSSKAKVDGHKGFSIQFSRDETLSLFHALGKFLHNKRETDIIIEMDHDAFRVKEKFFRLPLKMDPPEKVLCQANAPVRPVADFLHENVLDFISEEAIDDAWAVASYLSDADLLLASFQGMLVSKDEAQNVLQSAAASVACRGVLFGNSHPLPSRWHAIRKPNLWQVEQSALRNKNEMIMNNGSSSAGLAAIATEYTPVLKWLGGRTLVDLGVHDVWMHDQEMGGYGHERMNLDDQEIEFSDDALEG